MRNTIKLNSKPSRRTPPTVIRSLPAILAIFITLLGTRMLASQGTANLPPSARSAATLSAPKSHRHHVRTATPPPPLAEPEIAPSSAPVIPNWPANDNPGKPAVTWDSQGLRIDATNASLRQILTEVATATGAQVEGIGADERVFGEFGPGQARDVLSDLLHGSGYNVLMIGDQGQGTPRQIVLSARRKGNGPNTATAPPPTGQDVQDEDAAEPPEPEEQPMPQPSNREPMGQQGPPRTPQQVMQELLQRQQQMNQPQLNPQQPNQQQQPNQPQQPH